MRRSNRVDSNFDEPDADPVMKNFVRLLVMLSLTSFTVAKAVTPNNTEPSTPIAAKQPIDLSNTEDDQGNADEDDDDDDDAASKDQSASKSDDDSVTDMMDPDGSGDGDDDIGNDGGDNGSDDVDDDDDGDGPGDSGQ